MKTKLTVLGQAALLLPLSGLNVQLSTASAAPLTSAAAPVPLVRPAEVFAESPPLETIPSPEPSEEAIPPATLTFEGLSVQDAITYLGTSYLPPDPSGDRFSESFAAEQFVVRSATAFTICRSSRGRWPGSRWRPERGGPRCSSPPAPWRLTSSAT